MDDCRDRLAAARVARLATTGEDGQPHLVPVTFALVGDRREPTRSASGAAQLDQTARLVTAVDQKPKSTRQLRRLRNIEANPRVSLLVDHYSEDWRELWWVRADGTATVVAEDQRAIEALVAKYGQYRDDAPRGPVIEIIIAAWTGWAHS